MLQKSHIQALCFDVDGTLNDTDDVAVEKLAHWLSPLKFMLPHKDPRRAARRIVMAAETPGNALIAIPDRLGVDAHLAKMAEFFNRRPKPIHSFRLIEGVREMLDALRPRYPMSIVSARDEASTRRFLETFGLTDYFVCVAGALTVEHTKPYPDPILWAAEQMGVPPEACLMIGDTTVDIRAGRAAGAQTVGVLCGFGEEKELRRAAADLILPSTADLSAVLLGEN